MNVKNLTIELIADGLRNKEFSCQELTESYLRWIEQRNKDINAFITVNNEQALSQAKKIDKLISSGKKLKPLAGVPCAVKDNILIKDVKCTAGSKILSDYTASYNATVINRLQDSGAIFLGKTNMDEFAMGSSGESSYFGPTKNPHDEDRVPGGSSSGSIVAIADDQCAFALGSDTGGSIRQPASFCGVLGLKPTYGRVSRHGLMAMASSFDQISVGAKTAKDCALVLETISGKDEFDSTSANEDNNFTKNIEDNIKGLKIGLPKEFFVKGMDEKVQTSVLQAINLLRDMGAQVEPVSLPHTKYALSIYYILMPAEVSSNFARYDGVKYGFSASANTLQEMYLKTRSLGFGDEVKRRIMLGTFVLSAGYQDQYYKQAQKVRTLIKQDFDKAFEKVDCIVTPTTPSTAFKLGEKFSDPLTMYLADIFTVSANVAGLPAISIPVGKVNNLPVGMQLMAKHFDESLLLQVAHNFEQAQD